MSSLEELLALPCEIRSVNLLEVLLLNQPLDDRIFVQKVLPGETLATFLNRVYQGQRPYLMDCSCFAQLADLVLSGRWPHEGGNIMLCLDSLSLSGYLLWERKSLQMGYFGTMDPETNVFTTTLPTTSKG